MWQIESRTGTPLVPKWYPNRVLAEKDQNQLPAFFRENSKVVHRSENLLMDRMINEGLVKNDLERILLPRVSVDEYVPTDPNTDNVVIGFFLKGVPEAVIPFKNFCEKCNGVVNVDYGDSDTITNTSVVYVEMDRENIKVEEIKEMLSLIRILANFKLEDFTLVFPHTDEKFPFNIDLLQRYFASRSREKNRMAQDRAEKNAQENAEKELATLRKADQHTEQGDTQNSDSAVSQPQPDQEHMEALITRLGNTIFG